LDQNVIEPVSQEEPTTQPLHKRPAWLGFMWELAQTVILAIILYFLIDTVIGRVRVENISMQPTLYQGEFLLVNKLAYRLGSYNRGDIIIFHYSPSEDYIKRVIGMPGDHVRVYGRMVFVNDERLQESYIAAPPAYDGDWVVPEGQLFVLGDNRNQSSDSHSWGFVHENQVVGKALVVYWPLENMKLLNQVPVVKAATNP
jgi:signal peptidase I